MANKDKCLSIAQAVLELGDKPINLIFDDAKELSTARDAIRKTIFRGAPAKVEANRIAIPGKRGQHSSLVLSINGANIQDTLRDALVKRQIQIGEALLAAIARAERMIEEKQTYIPIGKVSIGDIIAVYGAPETYSAQPKVTPKPWRDTQPETTTLRIYNRPIDTLPEQWKRRARWVPTDAQLDSLKIPGV